MGKEEKSREGFWTTVVIMGIIGTMMFGMNRFVQTKLKPIMSEVHVHEVKDMWVEEEEVREGSMTVIFEDSEGDKGVETFKKENIKVGEDTEVQSRNRLSIFDNDIYTLYLSEEDYVKYYK